jgi:hypothetical protein
MVVLSSVYFVAKEERTVAELDQPSLLDNQEQGHKLFMVAAARHQQFVKHRLPMNLRN